jgi:hypothetical protein
MGPLVAALFRLPSDPVRLSCTVPLTVQVSTTYPGVPPLKKFMTRFAFGCSVAMLAFATIGCNDESPLLPVGAHPSVEVPANKTKKIAVTNPGPTPVTVTATPNK